MGCRKTIFHSNSVPADGLKNPSYRFFTHKEKSKPVGLKWKWTPHPTHHPSPYLGGISVEEKRAIFGKAKFPA